LPHLKELYLATPRVTDQGLTHVESLKELRYLQLSCAITDQGLAKLAALKKLEELISYGANMPSNVLDAVYALDEPSCLDCTRVPWRAVLEQLGEQHGMRFAVDEEALKAANGVVDSADSLVTYTAKTIRTTLPPGSIGTAGTIPLDAILTQILQPRGLMWEITPGGILVTTKEVVESDLAVVGRLKKSLPNLKKVRVCVDWKEPRRTRSAGNGR